MSLLQDTLDEIEESAAAMAHADQIEELETLAAVMRAYGVEDPSPSVTIHTNKYSPPSALTTRLLPLSRDYPAIRAALIAAKMDFTESCEKDFRGRVECILRIDGLSTYIQFDHKAFELAAAA